MTFFYRYALADSNINDANFEKLSANEIPDVILVKKFYGHDKLARRRARVWKLKHLAEGSMATDNESVFFFKYSFVTKSSSYFQLFANFFFLFYAENTMSSWKSWKKIRKHVKM